MINYNKFKLNYQVSVIKSAYKRYKILHKNKLILNSVLIIQRIIRNKFVKKFKNNKNVIELEEQNKKLLEEINESKENLEKMQRESIKIILKAKLKDAQMLEKIRDENSEMADKINHLSKLLEQSKIREKQYRRVVYNNSNQNNCSVM